MSVGSYRDLREGDKVTIKRADEVDWFGCPEGHLTYAVWRFLGDFLLFWFKKTISCGDWDHFCIP